MINGKIELPQLFIDDAYIGNYEDISDLNEENLFNQILLSEKCPHIYLNIERNYNQCNSCYLLENPSSHYSVDMFYNRNLENLQNIREIVNYLEIRKIIFQAIDIDNDFNIKTSSNLLKCLKK